MPKYKPFNPDSIIKKQEALAKKYGPETPLYDKMTEKYHTGPSAPSHERYWLYGITPGGKGVILGGYLTEDEAERDIISHKLEDALIEKFNTIDKVKATGMFKKLLADRTMPIDRAIERKGHEKTVTREEEKRAKR